MKKLRLNQMEKTVGGGLAWALGCMAGGILLGAVATPAVGVGFDIVCEVGNPESAQ